jgi:hypothetical protein
MPALRILVGKPESIWEDNIKTVLREKERNSMKREPG